MKIANASTQKMVINGVTRIFYNEENIKNLKREFKVHQNLFRSISKQMKTDPDFRLRLPLSVYLEYKGLCCMVTRLCNSEMELDLSDVEEWQGEMNFLENEGYRPEWFNYKKTGKFLTVGIKAKVKHLGNDEEAIRDYLKRAVSVGRKEKNHNLMFDSPISKVFLEVASKENSSTSVESL